VAWAALGAWLVTAMFGLNLAIRGGAIRLLFPTRWRPARRQMWSHRTLLVSHILLAVTGLGLWTWYTLLDARLGGWLALAVLALVAVHGLSLVERWTPGRGKHATGKPADHTRRGYFPVLAATAHIMFATVTVVLVTTVMLRLAFS
jgi:hypothetical protein